MKTQRQRQEAAQAANRLLAGIRASVKVQEWESRLDQLGPFASHDALAVHLDRAPAGSPTKDYLADYLAKHGGNTMTAENERKKS